ncbi:Hypothetical_protein [Hexamita inflata]|uniref:Hypothetical_protein n=1 Tax=Hexamita inflata TaxID=28002 RepID=A0ABP1HCB4_9EUKA
MHQNTVLYLENTRKQFDPYFEWHLGFVLCFTIHIGVICFKITVFQAYVFVRVNFMHQERANSSRYMIYLCQLKIRVSIIHMLLLSGTRYFGNGAVCQWNSAFTTYHYFEMTRSDQWCQK